MQNFHLGCQEVPVLYSVHFINVCFIKIDSILYTKSAKVNLKSKNLSQKCKDPGFFNISALYSVHFINVHFIEIDSIVYTESAKVNLKSKNLTWKCKDPFFKNIYTVKCLICYSKQKRTYKLIKILKNILSKPTIFFTCWFIRISLNYTRISKINGYHLISPNNHRTRKMLTFCQSKPDQISKQWF